MPCIDGRGTRHRAKGKAKHKASELMYKGAVLAAHVAVVTHTTARATQTNKTSILRMHASCRAQEHTHTGVCALPASEVDARHGGSGAAVELGAGGEGHSCVTASNAHRERTEAVAHLV